MTKDFKTPLNIPLTFEDMELGLKVARVGLGKVDYRADTLRCDALAAEFFGLDAGVELPRAELHARIHPEDWPQVEEGLTCLLSPEHPLQVLDMTHRILVPDVPLRWVNARKQVETGFTTVRDLGSSQITAPAIIRAIEAKQIVGPRYWTAGRMQ